MEIYKPNEFAKKIGVTVLTLQRWDNSGVLKANRTPTNRRYYTEEQLQKYLCYKVDISKYRENLSSKCPTHLLLKKPEVGYVFWRTLWNGYDIEVYGIEQPNQMATIKVWYKWFEDDRVVVETISGIVHEQLPIVWQEVEKRYKGKRGK